VQVTLSLAQPIRLSRTAEVGTSGGNLLNATTYAQQRPTPPAFVQGQDEQITTDENNMADLGDVTSSPLVPSNDKIPAVVESINDDSKLMSPQVQTEVPVSPSSAPEVDLPLFYPPRPVEQPKYRHPTHHSPPLRSKPQPARRYNSNDRLLGAAPFKPSMLGFPPISNTRENLGLQINWTAKIGRAHRSFYDFLLA
jgi:hypothetical protein